ncbi:MAG: hypothetical protein OEZ68_10840 [Gammaproteobacteria bacterium]|nr:hypothetical protein [Gammaproteobacteria bacterium]MDH5801289.1 hypothetical protein [Gammaproteobacteria bacterium]
MPHSHNTPIKLSRRRFIAFVAAIIASGALKAKLHPYPAFNQPNQQIRFADLSGLGPELDGPRVEEISIPLHPEQKLRTTSYTENDFRIIETLLMDLLRENGVSWSDAFHIKMGFQHYGLAHPFRHNADLLQYCRNVEEYLHHRIRNLFKVKLPWRLLSNHEKEIGQSVTFNAVIGRFTYYLLRARIIGVESLEVPSLVSATAIDRAIHYIESDNSFTPTRGLIYIIPGLTSLISPFSEILHLSLHKPARVYQRQLERRLAPNAAWLNARSFTETINEAAALQLSKEFLTHYNPARLKDLRLITQNQAQRLLLLPYALAYMRKKGVQHSIDLFSENPDKLLQQISKAETANVM